MSDQPEDPTPQQSAASSPNVGGPPAQSAQAAAAGGAASATWPSSAKTSVIIVTIVAIAAIVAAIVGFAQASNSDDDNAALEAERDAAVARAQAAEEERDALTADAAESESTIETLTAELDDAVDAQDDAVAAQDELMTELATETERADAAEGVLEELQAIVGQFPISLDSSLIPDDMPGDYTINYQEAYCDGFSTCGTLPSVSQARIYFTPDQFLRVEVPGILDAGLFALDGSLYGITDSLTALPPCGGADTRARVTLTMYAGSISVADDGTRTVNDINASITIDAPANGPDCPSGLVFYASSITPVE